MTVTTTNPTEQAAAETLATLIYEHTGFSESRCLRIAWGMIVLGNKKDDTEDEA